MNKNDIRNTSEYDDAISSYMNGAVTVNDKTYKEVNGEIIVSGTVTAKPGSGYKGSAPFQLSEKKILEAIKSLKSNESAKDVSVKEASLPKAKNPAAKVKRASSKKKSIKEIHGGLLTFQIR